MGIYRRKNEQYEAFVQVNYVKHRKTFDTRREAEEWIKKTEIEIDYRILLETTQ